MATVRVPVWNQTNVLRNHVPFIEAEVEGGGTMGDIQFNQTTLVDGVDEIEIVPNGGLLPVDDEKIIVVASSFGVIPPSTIDPGFGWTADRVSLPNKIILEAGIPVDSFYINIQFFIAAVA